MSSPTELTNMASTKLSAFDASCWRLLIWTMGLATPIITSLTPRRFIVGEIDAAENVGSLSHLVGRGVSFLLILFACVVVLQNFRRINGKELHRQARAFWWFSILLAATPTISTIILGGSLSLGILGTIMLYSATYFIPTPPMDWWIREVRVMLLTVFVYGSLVAAILFPEWALNLDYATESTTAIVPLRLFGTAEHANTLAPLAIFVWILGRFPNGRLRGEFFHGLAIFFVFLLSQSKTNWFIAILLLGIYLLMKISSLSAAKKYLTYFSIAAAFMLGLIYLVNFSPYAARIEDMMYDPQIFTLTGRLPLWLFAIDMWLEHPWIGQGLDAWSSKAVLDYIDLLGWGATHAHNQLLQILSQSGLLGLCVFALWIKYFIKSIQKAPKGVRTPLLFLILSFFLSGFTEVILQYGPGKASTIRTWLIFVIVLFVLRTTTPVTKESSINS